MQYYFSSSKTGICLQRNRLQGYTTSTEANISSIADTMWGERKSSNKKGLTSNAKSPHQFALTLHSYGS